MIGLTVDDTKLFMKHLLRDTTFDLFEMVSITLKTDITYEIDGMLNTNYFEEAPIIIYQPWSTHKPNIATLTKGPRAPLYFKIVLSLSQSQTNNIIQKTQSRDDLVQGFFINLVYDHPNLSIITGTNYKTFTMDKSAESYFDTSIKKFLDRYEIPYSL